ncbi:class I SAM-dependent methyltransferase [Phycisphaera mikurensis]|uniref:Uncharacterized protein n=1 Tax=Phycisphaera mikurensis (strain NBRC 102666 / KCTC 22515 / FYK2301M01) TaxID=1142394 RepID=I0IIR7_PHYMF|nr:class I SAM-dependent methyltransferase [Phycisphaera mikurensis]MBB6442695.1 2-polyprenyl-3-methyl-5-hydroxy-6-metoxy-1,4-benzoquinol methylase [Phycisphaera mikurensis]BAM05155.1 hypothetical protein PSMK_29960 [Phycisphaera mikurensis NBRC 102666]
MSGTPPPGADAIQRIARRFRGGLGGRYHRHYAAGKLRTDPAYAAVAERLLAGPVTPGPLLDVGCGLGLLAFWLRACGWVGEVTGVDPDEPKIRDGRQALAAAGDAATTLRVGRGDEPGLLGPGAWAHVVMLDVLHYFPAADQEPLLNALAAAVRPGGWVVLRATPRARSWRYAATRIEEATIRLAGWMTQPARHFPTVEGVTAPFAAAGFSVEARPLWGRTPFHSWLFAFRKPGGEA